MNQLIVFCNEQAMLWEACKHRSCRTEKCLFGRAVKAFETEEIGSVRPARYASVAAMERDRERLLADGAEARKAVSDPVLRTPVIRRTPVLKDPPK